MANWFCEKLGWAFQFCMIGLDDLDPTDYVDVILIFGKAKSVEWVWSKCWNLHRKQIWSTNECRRPAEREKWHNEIEDLSGSGEEDDFQLVQRKPRRRRNQKYSAAMRRPFKLQERAITAKMKKSSLEILIGTKNVTSRVAANMDRQNVAMYTLIKWIIVLNATNGDTCRQSAKGKQRKLKLLEANRHIRILPRGLSSRENSLLVTKQPLQKHLIWQISTTCN